MLILRVPHDTMDAHYYMVFRNDSLMHFAWVAISIGHGFERVVDIAKHNLSDESVWLLVVDNSPQDRHDLSSLGHFENFLGALFVSFRVKQWRFYPVLKK